MGLIILDKSGIFLAGDLPAFFMWDWEDVGMIFFSSLLWTLTGIGMDFDAAFLGWLLKTIR